MMCVSYHHRFHFEGIFAMSIDARARAEDFRITVEGKIKSIVGEFAEGMISREQFHVLYERYSSQLTIANHALASGNPDAVSIAQGGPPTIAVRDAYMGKARGLMIYHNNSGTMLETLGDFEVPVSRISPVLNDFSMMMESNQLIDRRVERYAEREWLLFVAGRFTTVVTLFRNEPSQGQIREIERLHHDFEEANRLLLERENFDTSRLAYPFLVFIKKKMKK
jgi:hypothetical protein